MTAEVILQVTYGIQIKEEDDPYVKIAEHGEEGFTTAAVPGAFMVDSFPILKYVPEWMPGAGFKKKAREWRESATIMRERPYKTAKDMKVRVCMVSTWDNCDKWGLIVGIEGLWGIQAFFCVV